MPARSQSERTKSIKDKERETKMNDHSAHADHDESSERHTPNDGKEHPRLYFLPGKIIAHIDHLSGMDPRYLATLINTHLGHRQNPDSGSGLPTGGQPQVPGTGPGLPTGGQPRVPDLGLADDVQPQAPNLNLVNDVQPVLPRNILTFPRPESQMPTFSIVPVELNRTDQQNVIDILSKINAGHNAKPFELAQDVVWRSESPNWLLGSAGHGGPHPPSPGSWPLPRKGATKQDRKFSLVKKDSEETQELPFAVEKGADVHVAILDTAPFRSDLDEAYEYWHEENELIERLLEPEPNRKLRLETDIYAEIELLDCSLARHRYWMADHGLFIAGEIASIAPESKIHLYKVFTSHGSASTLTLAQGLIRVLTDLTNHKVERPLIVNCSFGLAEPDPDDLDFSVYFQDFPGALRNSGILNQMQTSLRALFDELTNQDQVIVVAAAGDDTDLDSPLNEDKKRASARLPAAYDKVIGVGALPKGFPRENGKFKAASYSNFADNPPDTGYMTLGGEPGHGKGILGLYISEFPDYTGAGGKPPKDPKESTRDHLKYSPNEGKGEGNVEWAGASFAAPIITGLVANWCSRPPAKRADDPNEQAINVENVRLALNTMSETSRTAANERVIRVKQG
jgi:hypothetical protein